MPKFLGMRTPVRIHISSLWMKTNLKKKFTKKTLKK